MKTMNAMRSVAALLVLLCGAMVHGSAMAQGYPSRAIRFVVPSTTGITSDMLARLLGPKLSQRWNVPVVVENKAGAGGIICAGAGAGGRQDDRQISCFINNIGLGLQFAAVGALVHRLAREQGLGIQLPDSWFTEDVHP